MPVLLTASNRVGEKTMAAVTLPGSTRVVVDVFTSHATSMAEWLDSSKGCSQQRQVTCFAVGVPVFELHDCGGSIAIVLMTTDDKIIM